MAEETTSTTQSAQDAQETTSTETTNNESTEAKETAQNDSRTEVDLEKLIQKAVDRATNKLGNDNKKLREQLNALKKEKLTEDEIKKLEMAEKEADIADREAKLAEKENRLTAIRLIKEAGLDDGSNTSLELVDFVMANDEDSTRARVKAFAALVNKMITDKVEEIFKAKGRNPKKGDTGEYNATHAVVTSLGQMNAERQQLSNEVLSHYLGGK